MVIKRCGSLCTGVGGLDLGAESAGFKCVWQVEKDERCQRILRKHWPDVSLYDDMCTVGGGQLSPVDLIVGGTPCQPFSIGGGRQSLADNRGNLAFEFIRICDEIRPEYILWENVPGVLTTRDNAFGCFLGQLSGSDAPLVPAGGRKWTNAGMVVGTKRWAVWRVLDAQYFSVPQQRKRVFVLAGVGRQPRPEILIETVGLSRDSQEGTRTGQVTSTASQRSIGDNSGGESGRSLMYAVETRMGYWMDGRYPTLRACARHASKPQAIIYENHGQDSRIKQRDIFPTLSRKAGTGGNNLPLVQQGKTLRRLTPVECERLQAFNDNWTLKYDDGKTQSDMHRYQQMGNAVCVPVASWILKRLSLYGW